MKTGDYPEWIGCWQEHGPVLVKARKLADAVSMLLNHFSIEINPDLHELISLCKTELADEICKRKIRIIDYDEDDGSYAYYDADKNTAGAWYYEFSKTAYERLVIEDDL